MSINLFPSGVVTDGKSNKELDDYNMNERDESVLPISEGDSRINEFYKLLRGDRNIADSVKFRLDFIEAASSLYGDFLRWLKYQYKDNTLLYGPNLDLLTDTIRYIVSGERKYQLHTHQSLLELEPVFKPGIANDARWRQFQNEVLNGNAYDFDFSNYIGMWCRHPNGFNDMFHTTWLLFGEINWQPEQPATMTFISNV